MPTVLDWLILSLPALACVAMMPGPGFKWLAARFDDPNRAVAVMGMALGLGGLALYMLLLSPAAKAYVSGYMLILALVTLGNAALFVWTFIRPSRKDGP